MATGTIFTVRGHCDPAYTKFSLASVTPARGFTHDASFVAPVYAFQQPVPSTMYDRSGNPMTFTVNNAAANPGLINHITEEFVLDVRYPQGQEQDLSTATTHNLEALMISHINPAFGLSLTTTA